MHELFESIAAIFRSNPGLKKRLISAVIILACLIALFLFNYFLLFNILNPGQFLVLRDLSGKLFLDGISPYDVNLTDLTYTADFQIPGDAVSSPRSFISPVYLLFFYFPFALITNPQFSISLWLTINQVLLVLTIFLTNDLLNWKINMQRKVALSLFILLSYFSLISFINTSISILPLFLLILAMKSFFQSDDDTLSGVALGLMTISPSLIFFPLILFCLTIIRKGRISALYWAGITILLIGMAGVIFDGNWYLKLVRNLINQNNYSLIYTFDAVINVIPPGLRTPYLRYIIPLILVCWIIMEWLYMDGDNLNLHMWMMGLIICVQGLVFFQHIHYLSIFLSFPIIFIFYLWHCRVKEHSVLIIFGIAAIAMVGIPAFVTGFYSTLDIPLISFLQYITVFFIILMLYWVKWWVNEDIYSFS